MNTLAAHVVSESCQYLEEVYLARLLRALEVLPASDLWWRPHEDALSVGNILLHLEGNVRQWILSGIDGRSDDRDRAAEFATDDGPDGELLFATLAATVRDACDVIGRMDGAALVRPLTIQGTETNGVRAVLHVVEHFSWHVGQVVWIAKARAGARHGLAFFDDSAVNAARNRR